MKTLLLLLLLVPMMSFGQNNYSMSFDGVDDKVIIPHNSNQVGMSELSIILWAKFDSYPDWQNSNGGHMLFEKFEHVSSNADASYAIYTEYDEDALRFDVRLDNGNSINLRMEPFSSYLSLNTWYQIACVYDGQFAHIYFDGILAASTQTSNVGNIKNTNFPITMADAFNNNDYWNGDLDNISLWNIALSQQEIQQYMNCSPTGTETGLVGYWNFEEGIGTTAYDLTSNGNDGAINGATYSTDVPVQNCCTPTSSTDVHTACESYTWVDGTNYTASNNTATFTTINAAGCDSIIALDLTINSSSQSSFIVEGLDSYAAPSGTVYTTGGVYTDTIQNAVGCDSIITIDLSLNFTGIGELNNTPKQLIKIVDVLGRETPFKPNTPLLYIYNDGTVERKVVLK